MGYLFSEIDSISVKRLKRLQTERLRRQIDRVWHQVPYYRKTLHESGIHPKDIRSPEDLFKLPFTKKIALRDNYPFALFAIPLKEVIRLHCSSGTTGKPIVVGYSKKDIKVFAEVVARSLWAAGCRPGMKLQNAYGYGLFTGGLGLHYGAEKLGMTVIPISGGATEKQLMLLNDFKSDAICCTPSYALTLAEELKKRQIDVLSLKLQYAVLGAEPWTESTRSSVQAALNVKATNIYGLSEIIGPGVSQEDVDERGTGSYIWEDHFYPEIVDRNTGEPVKQGNAGVLVLTTLTKEAMPIFRYWTNDITFLYKDKHGKRNFIKMGPIAGRADDMLIIRGINLFHTQVEAMLNGLTAFSQNYQLVVTKNRAHDEVEVKVEINSGLFNEYLKNLAASEIMTSEKIVQACKMLEKKLKDNIGLSLNVKIEEPGTIPRSEGGKLNRILDLRQTQNG